MVPPPSTPPPSGSARPPLGERLKHLLAEYGAWALAVWFGLFLLTLSGFALALAAGFQVKGAAGSGGVLAGAYVATQLTKPVRILATLALTPLVARLGRRLLRRPG